MTLPSSFPLSMSQVATELGTTLPLSLLDPDVVALAGKSGPPVKMSDLLGKSAFVGNATLVAGNGSTGVSGYSDGVVTGTSSYGTLTPTTIDGVTIHDTTTYYPITGMKELNIRKSPGFDDNFISMQIVGPGTNKTYVRDQFVLYRNNIDSYLFSGFAAQIDKLVVGETYQIKYTFSPPRIITAGAGGGGDAGFQQGNYGSITYAPYRDGAVTGVYTDPIGFAFLLQGTRAQDYITVVRIWDNATPGTMYEFTTPSASSYGQNGGNTYWYWGTPPFTMVSGRTYTVTFA